MFCLKCGEIVQDNASFCPFCGTKIGENEDENKAIVYVEKYNADTHSGKNNSIARLSKRLENKRWIRSIAIVMGIIAVVLIVFGYKSIANSSYKYAVDNYEYYEKQMNETESMANLYGRSGILGSGYAGIASSWEEMLDKAQKTIILGRVKAGVGFGLGIVLLICVAFLLVKREKGSLHTTQDDERSFSEKTKKMKDTWTGIKETRRYTVVAAICLSLYSVIASYNIISSMIKYGYYTISLTTIISYIVPIAFAILLFIGKKNIGFLIATAGVIVVYIYNITEMAQVDLSIKTMGTTFLQMTEYLALFLLFLFSVIGRFRKYDKAIKYLWFLPSALSLISSLAVYIQWGYFSDLSYTWLYIFEDFCDVMAWLFVGLWLRADSKNNHKEISNITKMISDVSSDNEI